MFSCDLKKKKRSTHSIHGKCTALVCQCVISEILASRERSSCTALVFQYVISEILAPRESREEIKNCFKECLQIIFQLRSFADYDSDVCLFNMTE